VLEIAGVPKKWKMGWEATTKGRLFLRHLLKNKWEKQIGGKDLERMRDKDCCVQG